MTDIDTINIDVIPDTLLTLIVPDHAIAERFYCDMLGLFVRGIQTFLILKSNPQFAFQMEKPETDLMREAIGRQAGDGFLLVLKISSCEAILPKLKANGVKIFPPTGEIGWYGDEIFRLPWGNQIHCADPFGNKLCLMD